MEGARNEDQDDEERIVKARRMYIKQEGPAGDMDTINNTPRIQRVSFIEEEEYESIEDISSGIQIESSVSVRSHRRAKSTSEIEDFDGEADRVSIPRARSQSILVGTPLSKSHYSSLPGSPAVSFLSQFVLDEREHHPIVDFSLNSTVCGYKIGEPVGHGTFSECRIGTHLKSGKQVALKIIQPMEAEDEVMGECKREVDIWKRLQHPHILPLLNCVFIGDIACMCVTSLCELGNLADYLRQHGCLDEETAKTLFRQIAMAVEYMHQSGLVHRDIKLENILLDSDMSAFICDFGLTEEVGENGAAADSLDIYKGTPQYVPPEFIDPVTANVDLYKADIWALGIVLYAIVTGELPFTGEYTPRLYQDIKHRILKPLPRQLSSDLRSLIDSLLVKDPKRRPDIQHVLQSSWLR